MTEVATKLIVNCETGEKTIVPLSAEELAEREAMAAQVEAHRLAEEQAAAEKEAARLSATEKLETLGLTPEEIAALIGA